MISVVNFGMGNISSVVNAFRFWGEEVKVICTPKEIDSAHMLILPGVGSFREAILSLRKNDLICALNSAVLERRVPILGICLGMQIMASEGQEGGGSKGLGWIDGKVVHLFEDKYPTLLNIPHIGFNLATDFECGSQSDFYFCHSYKLVSESNNVKFGYSEYGVRFISSLQKDNIWGTQFHPEKSQSNGLLLIKRFITLGKRSV